MTEADFERRLERLFADAPVAADAAAFEARIARRLNAGWTARRWLVGTAGLAGGLIAARQLLMANLLAGAGELEASLSSFTTGLGQSLGGLGLSLPGLAGQGGGVVWMTAGLAIAALVYALSRVIEEI